MEELLDLTAYLDTIEGMEVIRNNTKNDDGTDTVAGVDWYAFDGIVCSNIYVNGNNWIGFGKSEEQLKICRRDGATYYVYRQEGIIARNIRFLKIRVEGYSRHNSTTVNCAVKYEIFMFDTGDMLINIIEHPTSTSYLGETSILFGGNVKNITLADDTAVPYYVTVLKKDDSYEIIYELITFASRRYLITDSSSVYTVDATGLIVIENLMPSAVTSQDFIDWGIADTIRIGNLLKELNNPKVLAWTDADKPIELQADVKARPYDQTVVSEVNMSDPSILNIKSIEATYNGLPLLAFSKDDGVIWMGYTAGEWIEGDMNMQIINDLDYQVMESFLGDIKKFKIRITLTEGSSIEDFRINFNNITTMEATE